MFLLLLLLQLIPFGIIDVKTDFTSLVNAKTSFCRTAPGGRSGPPFLALALSFRAAPGRPSTQRQSRRNVSPLLLAGKNIAWHGEAEDIDAHLAPSFDNYTVTENPDIDTSNVTEAQVLLACRAYLLRKHKVEWKEKKRRAQAAASSSNGGYFWPDPNELRLPADRTAQERERAVTESDHSFDNPPHPSEEHARRSNAKLQLWANKTWTDAWWRKRWAGKVATRRQKHQEKQDNLLPHIPDDVLESFDSMTGEEIDGAIVTYLTANKRKTEARRRYVKERERERESFSKWRERVQREARESKESTSKDTMQEAKQRAQDDALSFSPSAEKMKRLKAQRSEKSRMAYQTRLDNSKANLSPSSSWKITSRLRRHNAGKNYADNDFNYQWEGQASPMHALLRVDMALDDDQLPSPLDVEILLKPGSLGRRRAVLVRILRERFNLRGKCVPSLSGDSDLLFVTKCTIEELGSFVLLKLRQQIRQQIAER